VAALALRNASLFDELRDANRAKTEFLNMAAHELRTPISVLRGYVSMLGDGTFGGPPSGWKSPLEILEAKINELTKLSDELILASRLQSSASTSRRQRIDLLSVVSEAVDGAQPAAKLRGGSVAIVSTVHGPAVNADATQIRRVIDNLLINAITYCDRSPEVSVSVGRIAGLATVSVVDNGRGIPLDKWDLVFEQFARIERPEDRPGQGSGLGLYLARGLARLNGGDVRLVKSEPGAGSEFVLQLPLA
jgi:signal transduction histidine kinase